MTITEARQILEHYNNWRRDDDSLIIQPKPFEIGIAIDVAIAQLKLLESPNPFLELP